MSTPNQTKTFFFWIFLFSQRPIEQQYLKFTKEPAAEEKKEPSEDVMSQLLKYTLGFPETKVHDFRKTR